MKTYPLEIISMEESGYFSFGHHDKQAFADAVTEWERNELGDGYEEPYNPNDIRHVYWVEASAEGTCYDIYYVECNETDEGAFPVTVVYI